MFFALGENKAGACSKNETDPDRKPLALRIAKKTRAEKKWKDKKCETSEKTGGETLPFCIFRCFRSGSD